MKLLDLVPSFLKGFLSVIAMTISIFWAAFMAVNTFMDSKVAQAEERIVEMRNRDMEVLKSYEERSERELRMIRSQVNDIHKYLILRR